MGCYKERPSAEKCEDIDFIKQDKFKKTKLIKRSLSRCKGFTLIELIIVLGIMGVALMLTGTWLASQMPNWRLNGAARQIVSDLSSAKMKAVAERNRQRVIFMDDHRYALLDDDNNNGKSDPCEKLEDRDIQENYRDVKIMASNNPSFLPRGTASGLASIILSNSAGKRTITVSITGRVKIKS